MIIDPKFILEEGILDSPNRPLDLNKQLQSNGIDLRIRFVESLNESSWLKLTHGGWSGQPERVTVHPDIEDVFTFYASTAYNAECFERVNIPKNMVAVIYGRSTLNRNGVIVRAALYDSGFHNFVGFTIYPFVNMKCKIGTRLAQIVFYESGGSGLYDGQYNKD